MGSTNLKEFESRQIPTHQLKGYWQEIATTQNVG